MRSFAIFSLAFALVMVGVGCGDGAASPNPDAGTPLDQCESSGDMAIILASRMDAGAGVDGGYPNPLAEAYACALTASCYSLYLNENDSAGLACVHDCMASMPSADLSLGCLDCFAGGARTCAAANCLLDCIGNDLTLCNSCFATHCQAQLTACIGY